MQKPAYYPCGHVFWGGIQVLLDNMVGIRHLPPPKNPACLVVEGLTWTCCIWLIPLSWHRILTKMEFFACTVS